MLGNDARLLQLCEAAARDLRIGIDRAADDALHTRTNQRIGTRRRAALIRMRLERHVHGRAVRRLTGSSQRDGLGMRFAPLEVRTFADDALALYDDTADARIRLRREAAELGELERAPH